MRRLVTNWPRTIVAADRLKSVAWHVLHNRGILGIGSIFQIMLKPGRFYQFVRLEPFTYSHVAFRCRSEHASSAFVCRGAVTRDFIFEQHNAASATKSEAAHSTSSF